MYKLSVPISIERFNENKSAYFRELKKANVDRVFLAALSHELYIKDDFLYDNIDLLCKNVQELREKGYEVGFWFNSFGHGTPLLGVDETETGYIRITGSDGEKTNAICPLDKNFRRDYAEGLLQLAKANPDYIMLDDDFRLNTRKYNLGCCCDQHMQEYQKRLGEKVEREDVYSKSDARWKE